jgi:serine/threonine-protein kinase
MATISAVGRAPAISSTGGPLSEDARAFLQARVASYGLFGGIAGTSFLLLRTYIAFSAERVDMLLRADVLAHALGASFFLAMWLVCRRGQRSPRFIEWTEAVCLVGSCLSYVAMGSGMPILDRPDMVVQAALTMGLVLRSIYVPSSARRTLAFGAIIGVGYVAMVLRVADDIPEPVLALARRNYEGLTAGNYRFVFVSFAVLWWGGTMAITTAASQVIYGLRREMRNVRKLGQYTLVEKIGEGGMGAVHRAQHGMLQRPTAVKLLPPEKAGEHSVKRFEREVQLTAKLTHPNTITVFDYGRTPDNVFYYAMELLDGADLEQIVKPTGPMPAARAIHVLHQVAGALNEAHEVGLIHRDIKPQNVMLCRRGGISDFVKVLDFGLVKRTEQSHEGMSLTGTNVITGTPHFMAPEALKDPEGVDGRSDLYALGVVGYFLVTGKLPFDGKSLAEICGHHLHSKPEPPSKRVAELPSDLEQLLLECLAKDADQRPASAAELRRRLEACGDFGSWSDDDARAWWEAHADEVGGTASRHDHS